MIKKLLVWRCNTCGKVLKKPYRINIFYRDPSHKYVGSGLQFIYTENMQYCKQHYQAALKRIKKVL